MNFLLDTNIVLIYIRDTELTRRLESRLNLLRTENNLVLSVVTLGELLSISKQNSWGQSKTQQMERILSRFVIADIHVQTIIERYAEIDAFSQGRLTGTSSDFSSRNMGKNDIWIAATASVLGLELLTTDKDFDHLHGHFVKLNRIDPTII
ncbi:MAG: PIN domain-containing protein [Saprospiraceae bacterium]|nr:PIN domain-containing protein [Saprospiraceae bacterium]